LIVRPSPFGHLADVQAFLGILATRGRHPLPEVRSLFTPGTELVVTRAPGRLDVMGGIADYSGSLVLELPLREAALVALGPREDRRVRIVSLEAGGRRALVADVPLADLERDREPIDYEHARALFRRDPSRHWASYVAGVWLVLMRERGLRFARGFDLLLASSVPAGKGVSSSAALEVATMQAVTIAEGLSLGPRDLALLCQKVENLVVGAPCGVMDQMTSAGGEADQLMALLCQPAELQGQAPVPEGLAVFGIDSGLRHAVTGSDYTAVRVGAFMGYRILADLAGLPRASSEGDRVCIEDPRWHGYLANVTPSELEQWGEQLPARLGGQEFLERYFGTTDTATRVDPEASYAVRVPTAHPILEHRRVHQFADLLAARPAADSLPALGRLMYQSHASYSACGLGSSGTDRLVRLVQEAGPARGLHGAKITGGGSGGTVAVLGEPWAAAAVEEIAAIYGRETGRAAPVFSGSSPGAIAFDHLCVKLEEAPD
jgi:galactokinase